MIHLVEVTTSRRGKGAVTITSNKIKYVTIFSVDMVIPKNRDWLFAYIVQPMHINLRAGAFISPLR